MKKRKVKWKNVIMLFLGLICLSVFCYSSYRIINRLKQKSDTNKLIDNINSQVEIKEDTNVEPVIPDDTDMTQEEKIDYYYEYLKVPFISVDFTNLKEINNDVKGWLNVIGAGVNYPYVQTTDNKYYLIRSFDKSRNDGGWVFLDYRNNPDNIDKNTIIYAHGGLSFAMFGPLKKLYDSNEWFLNKDNHYIKIATEKSSFVYKVFSLYVINTTSDYLKINFDTDNEYKDFLETITNRSHYKFDTDVDTNNRIITLSTCYNKKQKLVIHAKLIKETKR